jgi:hypothetical protein
MYDTYAHGPVISSLSKKYVSNGPTQEGLTEGVETTIMYLFSAG